MIGSWIDLDDGEVRVQTTAEGGLEISLLIDPEGGRAAHEMDAADAVSLREWIQDWVDR